MNVGSVFEQAVSRRPTATALVDRTAGVRYTYETWYDRCTDVARALAAAGIESGDFVATAMRNRVETSTIYCATQLLGAVFVPYNFRASTDELDYLVDNTDPDVLFFSAEVADVVDTALGRTRIDCELVAVDDVSVTVEAADYDAFLAAGDDASFSPTVVATDETSILFHTSGTTGQPKGVPLTHENCYAAGMAHVIQNGWTQGESTLGMMTLSHTMGIHSLVAILLLGGKWVIQRRVHVPEILDQIAAERITSLYLTPTVYHQIFESGDLETADLSSVRRVASASSNLSRSTIAAIERHVDPDRFVNHYGSTEIYTLAVYDAPDEKLNCVGRAGVNTRIRVVELDGTDRFDPTATAAPGELGEIVVDATSPEAFDGYLSPDTERSVVDGWFLTGDLGYRDEDGDLFFVGRVDDMINSGGENIYPVEVETVLERHDAVDEAVVVGRPSERWNQTVVAFVTLVYPPSEVDFGTAADALDEHCLRSDELADYKRPRKYFFIDEFSKNYVGKILRRELQKDSLDIDVHGEIEV